MTRTMQNGLYSALPAIGAATVLYYALARAGLFLALPGTASCPIWPASGFAVVAALMLGPEGVLGVFLGSWLANLHAAPGSDWVSTAAYAIAAAGSALQAGVGASVLRGPLGGPNPLSRGADVVRFGALTPPVCLIGASMGVAALVTVGVVPMAVAADAWLTWWVGDIVGVFLVAPLLLAWRPGKDDQFGDAPSPRRALEACGAMALLTTTVWLGFDVFAYAGKFPIFFLPLLALIWIGLRLELRGATAGACMLAVLVHWHTISGAGPFALEGRLNDSLLFASFYIAAAALTSFLLRAVVAQLGEATAELEKRVEEQSAGLSTAEEHLRAAALGRREDGRRIQIYRRIFGELPIGLAVLRLENPRDVETWEIVEFNPAALRLSNAVGETAVGRRLLDFAPTVRGSELPRACVEAINSGHEIQVADFPSGRVPGARFSITAFPLGGDLVGIAFEDVTARKNAEDALARSNAELSQFAYVASHDLQAPLRKAALFAEQLRQRLGDGLDQTSLDFMTRMTRSISSMQRLIDSMHQLARDTARAAAPEKIELAAVAAEVVADLEPLIARAKADVRCHDLPVLMGDPVQMRQLVQNLIGNALKFTTPEKAPIVRLHGRVFDDGRRELVIEDNGVGFDMQAAARLFEPFQRLHSAKDYPGSGMGLAICRKIVERHGGAIEFESHVGLGTRFTIVFPAALSPERVNVPVEAAAAS